MAKRIKREVEKFGGRKLRATVGGKEVVVKKDPHNLTYHMNPPKRDGKGRERIWLSRDLGYASQQFWAYVEQSYQKHSVELPTDKITKVKDYSHLTSEGTIESWRDTVNADPLKVFSEFSKDILQIKTATSREEIDSIKQATIAKYTPRIKSMIPEEVLIRIFKEWLQDPYECALRLGDERIANLDKLSTRDAIKLKEMGEHYFNWIPTHKEQASETQRKKVVKWWNNFIRITGKIYLDELSKSDIQHYTSIIVSTAKKGNWSKTWIAHHFSACINIINTYAITLEDKSVCYRVKAWLKDYPAPKSVNETEDIFNPNCLSKEQWLELLALVSNNCTTPTRKKWRAIILFALNTCSYGVDCRNVLVKNIDGNKLRMRRGKTGKVAKIGILWEDTLEAIADFRQGKIANSKYVFPSKFGTQYSENGFYNYWSPYIRPKLSWNFDFRQLRDSGRYGAETDKASPNKIKMAMGHRIEGEDDAYLFRHPELVQDVSDAIYNYYML